MSSSNPAKSSQDIELIKADVASFASSLGLSSATPSTGFNDSDFRKTGKLKSKKPIKRQSNGSEQNDQNEQKQEKPPHEPKSKSFNRREKKSRSGIKTEDAQKKNIEQPKPKSQVLSIDNEDGSFRGKRFEKFKTLPKLPLVKASLLSPEWFKDAAELQGKVLEKSNNLRLAGKNVAEWKSIVEKKRELGERLMWQYTQDFDSSKGKSGDFKMVMAAQKSGTEADKVTAFEIMVGENPIANIRSLDALRGMVTSKVGKRYAFKGFKALSELFVKLLPDRKLKTLMQQPLNSIPETKDGYSLLLFWYWEECLKQRYERFVVSLEEGSRDLLPQLKDKALKTIYFLLTSKSEQERRLLSSLVNKLGDPQNKSASNADFHLSNLLSDHPNMKAVVIDEVDTLLFRPHLGLRAKYHAVNFLSQFRLSHRGDGPKVAKRLIDVYFALFKVLITEASSNSGTNKANEGEKKGSGMPKDKQKSMSESHVEMDSRLLSALLTGINRAFPYVSTDEADDVIEVQTPMLFKLVHSKNFNVGVQALMLLDKISSKNQVISDRFYRALYSKLLLPAVMNSSKAEMFIGLVLRAMKNDINLKRVAAFSKRMLQVALQQPPQYACGCLFLLSEVLKARPPLWNMVLQSELVDEEIEHFEDIREESDTEPTKEEKKETADSGPEHNVVAVEENNSSEDEDDLPDSGSDKEEDDDDDSVDEEELLMRENHEDFQETKVISDNKETKQGLATSFLPGGYDPRHREPSYCNGHRASWWELMVLSSHVHPSVATMAGTLLSGSNIVYNGNPLNDLSLTAFLDKFMEKKPKATTWHGGSQIEPAKKLDMTNHLIGSEILSLAEMEVPPEDLVFHKFYVNKMESTKKLKKKKKKLPEEEAAEELFDVGGDGGDESDDGDVDGGDDSDNEEIENLLDVADGAAEPEIGGYDYDDLDQVAEEDDEDLVGNGSDPEMDFLEGEEFDDVSDDANDNDDDDDDIKIGDVDDDDADDNDNYADAGDGDSDDEDDEKTQKKLGKRKRKKAGASPFASLEEYEQLIEQDANGENKTGRKRKSQPRKKKKKSSK